LTIKFTPYHYGGENNFFNGVFYRNFELKHGMPLLKKKIKTIAVVDDHELFRTAVKGVIQNFISDNFLYKVAMEAENGKDFIDKTSLQSAPIDIVILDIHMPIMDGYETLKWINSHQPQTKVLILSMNNSPEIVAACMKDGASGYLTKTASQPQIETAVKSIATKGFFYDDFITQSLILVLKNGNNSIQNNQAKDSSEKRTLTKREIEFLTLLGTDSSYKEIADKMQISLRTVDGYREELFRKFNVNSRVSLVIKAIKYGFINF
jgi:two-component system invasion response regulator UvrY